MVLLEQSCHSLMILTLGPSWWVHLASSLGPPQEHSKWWKKHPSWMVLVCFSGCLYCWRRGSGHLHPNEAAVCHQGGPFLEGVIHGWSMWTLPSAPRQSAQFSCATGLLCPVPSDQAQWFLDRCDISFVLDFSGSFVTASHIPICLPPHLPQVSQKLQSKTSSIH